MRKRLSHAVINIHQKPRVFLNTTFKLTPSHQTKLLMTSFMKTGFWFPVNKRQHVFANPTNKAVYFTSDTRFQSVKSFIGIEQEKKASNRQRLTIFNPPCISGHPNGIRHNYFPK